MILSGKDILQRIHEGEILVDPPPGDEQIQPASLDVHIGSKIIRPYDYPPTQAEVQQIPIGSGECVLAETEERVSVPDDLAVQLTGRSTLGRMFISLHQTAGWCDPGWDGHITMELKNHSPIKRTLEPGDRIGQLVFFPTSSDTGGYDGQYEGEGPEMPGEL